jgi:uncharacterized protein (TIGR02246 family)
MAASDLTDTLAITVATRFVAAINAHDVDELVGLMTDDHCFVDSLGHVVSGREQMRHAWRGYFALVPDYSITIERIFSDRDVVVLCGVAGGTLARGGDVAPEDSWSTPVALRACITGSLVAEWRVYADNEPLRALMRR